MDKDNSSSSAQFSVIMEPIKEGMALEKCHKCGCMLTALTIAERAFSSSESATIKALVKSVEDYKAQMGPIAYDCLGCKVCLGAEATRMIVEAFGDSVLERGASICAPYSEGATVCSSSSTKASWPPYRGEYVVGDPSGSIAVCTLASHDLTGSLMGAGKPGIAISGICETENIGVEKVVLNITANPNIRWLILCGKEAEGHRPGDAFQKLKELGVDAAMRIQKAASWRPVLKNLTMLHVTRFRQQVEIVDMIGRTELASVLNAVHECASHPREPMSDSPAFSSSLTFERVKAKVPKRLGLDPAGFFIILPDKTTGVIACEHYENSGRLMHVIEGKDSALIAATAVEQGLITRLDHAAYLGRELAKAEFAIKTGTTYIQDAALGEVPQDEKCSDSTCSCHSTLVQNQIRKL